MSEQKAKKAVEPLFELREYEAELFAPAERKVEAKVEEAREAELIPDAGSMIEGIMQPMVMMLTLGMVMPVMQQAMVGVLQSTEVTVIVKPGSIVAVDVKNSVLAVEVKEGQINVTLVDSTIAFPTDVQAATIALPVDIQGQTLNVKIDIAAQSIDKIAIDIAAQSVGNIDVNIATVSEAVTFDVKIIDASGVTFNVKITDATGVTFNVATASGVTLNIHTPSGAWVSASDTVTKYEIYPSDAPDTTIGIAPGSESGNLISDDGRGRLKWLVIYGSGGNPFNNLRLRIYVGGDLKIDARLDALAAHIGIPMDEMIDAVSKGLVYGWPMPVWGAQIEKSPDWYIIAPLQGGVNGSVYAVYDKTNSRIYKTTFVLKPDLEYQNGIQIRLYNDGIDYIYVWVAAFLGEYL